MTEYQGAPHEKGDRSSSSTGTIVAIIVVVAIALIGVPVLACGGMFAFGVYQARQAAEEAQRRLDEERRQVEAEKKRQETILKARVLAALKEKSKDAVSEHWTWPAGVKRWSWSDRRVKILGHNRFEIHGNLKTVSDVAGQSEHRWSCEYTTLAPPGPGADWQLQRVTVDGEQFFP